MTSLPPAGKRSGDTDNPCVRNCCLDEHDICVGCGRTLEDIRQWSTLDETARRKRLADAEARVRAFRARWGA